MMMSKIFDSKRPLRGFAAGGHFDAVPFLAESDLQQLADGAFVVDDQNVSHAVPLRPLASHGCASDRRPQGGPPAARQTARGSSTVNSAPRSFSEVTEMRPLCACTI